MKTSTPASDLLMPLGLEALALAPMGWGISALLMIAEAASGWPHAAIRVAMPAGWALGMASLGGLWLCVWRGHWRFWGIAGVVAGLIAMVWPGPGPDVKGFVGAFVGTRYPVVWL